MTTFNESNLIKKLEQVSTTQDSIQSLSLWVLHHRSHCKQIVEQWLNCYRKSKSSHQLALFYLANDIVQHSKRKSVNIFLNEFKHALREASKVTNDAKIIANINRVLTIWADRSIYSKEFIDELRALLSDENSKLELISKIVSDYSSKDVIAQIGNLSKLEKQTQAKIESSLNCPIDFFNNDLLNKLKDKSNGEQFNQEFEEAAKSFRLIIEAFDKEIIARKDLLAVLEKTNIYYDIQFKEAKTVGNAFSNCEVRVNQVKAKLDATFPNASSNKKSASTIADSIPTSTLRSVINTIQQAQNANNSTSSLDQRLTSLMSNSGQFGLSLTDENNSPFQSVYDPNFQPFYNPSMDFSSLYGSGGSISINDESKNAVSSSENTEPADMDLVNSDDDSEDKIGGKINNFDDRQKPNKAIETGPVTFNVPANLMGLLNPLSNLPFSIPPPPPPPPPPPLPPSLKDFFPEGDPFAAAHLAAQQNHHIAIPPGLMVDLAAVQQQLPPGNSIRSLADSRSQRNHSLGPYTLHPPNVGNVAPNNWRNNGPNIPNQQAGGSQNNNNHFGSNMHANHSMRGSNHSNRGWKGNHGGNRGSWKQRNSYGNHN